jgi:hypothetical protein
MVPSLAGPARCSNARRSVTVAFSEAGILTEGPNGKAESTWEPYLRTRETPEFLLLYYGKSVAVPLPRCLGLARETVHGASNECPRHSRSPERPMPLQVVSRVPGHPRVQLGCRIDKQESAEPDRRERRHARSQTWPVNTRTAHRLAVLIHADHVPSSSDLRNGGRTPSRATRAAPSQRGASAASVCSPACYLGQGIVALGLAYWLCSFGILLSDSMRLRSAARLSSYHAPT